MTTDPTLRIAQQYHRAGRRREAEAVCRQILAREPNDPDALHLMGILNAQAGHLDSALELIRQAVGLRPGFADAWGNLGCVLVNARLFGEAIEAYRRLTRLRPTDAAPHFALGILLHELGHPDEAVAAFTRATELQPDLADAHARLGAALRSRGRLDEAIAAYSRAVALRHDRADAHNDLANVLRDKGVLDEAIAHYTRAAELAGDDAVIQFNLGNALFQQERFAEALPPYVRALRIKPDYFEAQNLMGLALSGLQRYEEAAQAHRRAIALRPDDASAHEALGSALVAKHDFLGAEASFRRALALSPGSPTAWSGLGTVFQVLGRFDEASDCFQRALAIDPDRPAFHRNLISLGPQDADPAEVERLARLLHQVDLTWQERSEAGFALGKLLDDAGRFDDAFAYFSQANALLKQSPAAALHPFDGDRLRQVVDGMIQGSTAEFFARRRHWGEASELPVFIVGMPRSGTTLVEQIAASHPSVYGAGELTEIGRIAAALSPEQDRGARQGWDAGPIARAARAHVEHLRSFDGSAARITDKMPGNIFHLGLIAVLFPCARVIFCRRDARDISLSCYFQRFGNDRHRYTFDLQDCGRQCLETDRLIDHWLKVLPLRMLEVQYEAVVADQEVQSRRLIEFLGLPWDPACLEFHRTQRPVMTASVWQVRQPIYSRSVGRWRHYEQYLGPLLSVLDRRTDERPLSLK